MKNIIKLVLNIFKQQMKPQKLSKKGIDFLTDFEGFSSKPYLDVVGIPTIGYGFTYYPTTNKKVKMTDKSITKEEGKNLLSLMLKPYELAVQNNVTANINQNQFDALVSFAYNVGVGAFRSSTLLKRINANPKDADIKNQFLRWNKAGGKVVRGLTRRREEEAKMYFS